MQRPKPLATKPPPLPEALPLADRIRAMRAEIDKAIDDYLEEIADEHPGVPQGVIRGMFTNKAPGCQCAQALLLEDKI
jgi:hypothetical protein